MCAWKNENEPPCAKQKQQTLHKWLLAYVMFIVSDNYEKVAYYEADNNSDTDDQHDE